MFIWNKAKQRDKSKKVKKNSVRENDRSLIGLDTLTMMKKKFG